jgi:hypothetical protein
VLLASQTSPASSYIGTSIGEGAVDKAVAEVNSRLDKGDTELLQSFLLLPDQDVRLSKFKGISSFGAIKKGVIDWVDAQYLANQPIDNAIAKGIGALWYASATNRFELQSVQTVANTLSAKQDLISMIASINGADDKTLITNDTLRKVVAKATNESFVSYSIYYQAALETKDEKLAGLLEAKFPKKWKDYAWQDWARSLKVLSSTVPLSDKPVLSYTSVKLVNGYKIPVSDPFKESLIKALKDANAKKPLQTDMQVGKSNQQAPPQGRFKVASAKEDKEMTTNKNDDEEEIDAENYFDY